MQRERTHLTYANVVATLALVVAVAGGSTAIAISAKKNSVGTKALKNHSVTAAKLAADAVTAEKIAPGAVGNAQLVDGSVTASKLTGVHEAIATDTPTPGRAVPQCASGEKLLGGGGGNQNGALTASLPAPPLRWEADGPTGPVSASALCLKATPGG